jgi:hypothetical protein
MAEVAELWANDAGIREAREGLLDLTSNLVAAADDLEADLIHIHDAQ